VFVSYLSTLHYEKRGEDLNKGRALEERKLRLLPCCYPALKVPPFSRAFPTIMGTDLEIIPTL